MTPIEQILAAITIHEPSGCWIYPVLLNTGYGRTSERGHWRIPETAITAYIAQRQENPQ